MYRPKIYPSAGAFMFGDLVITEYDSACLRSILIKAHGIQGPEIDEANAAVGQTHEAFYARELAQFTKMAAEVPLKGEIDGIAYSGRADFITDHGTFRVIHETKGTISKNTYKKVIKEGKYKINHLAQLVFYMIRFQIDRGKIVSGYYEQEDYLFIQKDKREFKVVIQDSGEIYIDGSWTGYTVQDQLNHQIAQAEVLKNKTIWCRPDRAEDRFGSPCSYCPFKNTCIKYDTGVISTVDELVESARQETEAVKEAKEAKLAYV